MSGDGRGDEEGFEEMNMSKGHAGVPRMSLYWKRPVNSPQFVFKLQIKWLCMCAQQRACTFVCKRRWEGGSVKQTVFIVKWKTSRTLRLKLKEEWFFSFCLKGNLGLTWKWPLRRKTWYNQPQCFNRTYGVCSQWVCVFVWLVWAWFQLESTFISGRAEHFLASARKCISICVSKCMCVLNLV